MSTSRGKKHQQMQKITFFAEHITTGHLSHGGESILADIHLGSIRLRSNDQRRNHHQLRELRFSFNRLRPMSIHFSTIEIGTVRSGDTSIQSKGRPRENMNSMRHHRHFVECRSTMSSHDRWRSDGLGWKRRCIRSPVSQMMDLPVLGRINSCSHSVFNRVTISAPVEFWAMKRGTPTWSMVWFGSGVLTDRPLKSTRLPIRLYVKSSSLRAVTKTNTDRRTKQNRERVTLSTILLPSVE